MSNSLVEIKNLSIQFPEGDTSFEAVKDVSFQIQEGEILGVVGESGSGKSMSALALMGLLSRDAVVASGEILFRGQDLLQMEKDERRKLQGSEMAMVFQEPMTSLNPVLKIEKQVGESLRLHTNLTDAEIHEKVVLALLDVGLNDAEGICKKYPHELSGGMRQRVMLAQGMICSPSLLIADEPTTALDVIVQAQILQLLKKIHREKNTSILFISHDLNVVRELCSRVLVMYQGEIVEEGETREVLLHPKHAYTRHLMASIPEQEDFKETEKEVLRLKHLDVSYDIRTSLFQKKRKKHVIHDVSLAAHEGEILGIVGESGCGKSTLCKTILGLHNNYTGTFWAEKGSRSQMVFQDPFSSLNPSKKIGWILEEPLRLRGITNRKKRQQIVADMLNDIGLDPSFAERKPRELSGGQRQRISIGAALLMDSRLLIADEPVSALDVTVQSQILSLLLKLHRERNMTILFISHDLHIVRKICHRVLVIYKGEIVEEGFSADIYNHPAHPYTRLLLDAVLDEKRSDGVSSEEKPLPDVVDAAVPADFAGCRFYTRCPERCDKCREQKPTLRTLGEGHQVRCWNFLLISSD